MGLLHRAMHGAFTLLVASYDVAVNIGIELHEFQGSS